MSPTAALSALLSSALDFLFFFLFSALLSASETPLPAALSVPFTLSVSAESVCMLDVCTVLSLRIPFRPMYFPQPVSMANTAHTAHAAASFFMFVIFISISRLN